MAKQQTLPGSLAPEFRLQDHDEHWTTLSELTLKSSVLLAFYPGDFTSVCSKQLCAYQDNFDEFVSHGVQIVGISPNDAKSHQEFRKKYHFKFPLLTDPKKDVFKTYGVISLFMLGGTSRAVFLISGKGLSSHKQNRILYRYIEPTILTHRRPGELLAVLKKMKDAGSI